MVEMKENHSTPQSRWAKRSLGQQLLHKFLHEYGYEHGRVVAQAIVADILELIDQAYGDTLPPQHVHWLTVPVHNGHTGKSPDITELVTVRLQIVTDEEVALLNDQQLLSQYTARRTFNQHRYARWCQEAYQQGGVLTLLDLSLLSGLTEGQVGNLIRQYEAEHQMTVPLRGTVHDIGPAVSHKAEVVRRYLRGQSPADIARELNHSQKAVDVYIKDYEVTRKLAQRFPQSEISALSGRASSVVKEHIKLIQQYEPDLVFFEDSCATIAAKPSP
jgi:predicted transcriptional regulator